VEEGPVESVQTNYGEFIRDDFCGEITSSFERMHFILRDHVTPQRSIRSSLIIGARGKDIMPEISISMVRGLRPDIVVAVTGNDGDCERI
jgi:hypothetical protein